MWIPRASTLAPTLVAESYAEALIRSIATFSSSGSWHAWKGFWSKCGKNCNLKFEVGGLLRVLSENGGPVARRL